MGGFPYTAIFIGYSGIRIILETSSDFDELSSPTALTLMGLLLIPITIGLLYNLYWLVSTGRVLRDQTNESIPSAILLVVPLANYWWMWRYAQAAEKYTKDKVQGALGFLVIAALGSIGNAIMQDYYNKLPKPTEAVESPAPTIS